uniref:class I SAM-dependent methyltransferase n=1 Tax=Orrella sp. TaxID=1921583 RepID=UPI00404899EC
MKLDALAMNLADNTVRCIYAINVFHHLPDPDLFFAELARVLHPGGGCILIEPHCGFASSLLHRHLHSDEHFDPNAPEWRTVEIGETCRGRIRLWHISYSNVTWHASRPYMEKNSRSYIVAMN